MVTPVTPVILTLMNLLMETKPVKLNAHLVVYATNPPHLTVARWIVSQTATNALTPPPVTPVQMVITLMTLMIHARLAPQTAMSALTPPPVPTVQLVLKVLYATNVQMVITLMTAMHARLAPQTAISAMTPPPVPTVQLVSPVLYATHVQLVLKIQMTTLQQQNVTPVRLVMVLTPTVMFVQMVMSRLRALV